jgi:hypothetical protein
MSPDMVRYGKSATCNFSGVHHLDAVTGECVFCGLLLEKTAAAQEMVAKKKGVANQAHPLRRLLPPR